MPTMTNSPSIGKWYALSVAILSSAVLHGDEAKAQASDPSQIPPQFRQPSVAVPWNKNDQTAALQSAISASDQHKSTISLFGADYLISDTLTWGAKLGLAIRGVAPGTESRVNPNLTGAATRLVWRGPDDGRPMLTLGGSHAMIGGFALSGRLQRGNVPATTLVGIRLEKLGKGIGTGKMHFDTIGCYAMDVGIQIGVPGQTTMANCDLLSCNWYEASGVRAALQVNNQMGMSQHFDNVILRGCETFAEVFAGGDLTVDKLFTAGPCTLLSIRQPGPGTNNGIFRISSVKVDQQAGSGFKLLAMEAHAPIDVTFDGGAIAYDHYTRDGATLIDAVGASRIVIRDWKNLQGQTIKLTAVQRKMDDGRIVWQQPFVVVETSRMGNGIAGDLANLIHPDSSGPYTLTARECCDESGKPLKNVTIQE